MDLTSPDGVLTGPVRSVNWEHEDEAMNPRAASLRGLLDVWLSALDLGLWFWNDQGAHWDADHDAVPAEWAKTDLVE